MKAAYWGCLFGLLGINLLLGKPRVDLLSAYAEAQHTYLTAIRHYWEARLQESPARSVYPLASWKELQQQHTFLRTTIAEPRDQVGFAFIDTLHQQSLRIHRLLHLDPSTVGSINLTTWKQLQVILGDIDATQARYMYLLPQQQVGSSPSKRSLPWLPILSMCNQLMQAARTEARGILGQELQQLKRERQVFVSSRTRWLSELSPVVRKDPLLLQHWQRFNQTLGDFIVSTEAFIQRSPPTTPTEAIRPAIQAYNETLLPLYARAAHSLLSLGQSLSLLTSSPLPFMRYPTPWLAKPAQLSAQQVPTHYLFVLDGSPQMAINGIYEQFQASLPLVQAQMTALDRCTILAPNGHVILAKAPKAALGTWVWPKAGLPGHPYALKATLEQTYQFIRPLKEGSPVIQLILVSDGSQPLTADILQLVDQQALLGTSFSVAWYGATHTETYVLWASLVESCQGIIAQVGGKNKHTAWQAFR